MNIIRTPKIYFKESPFSIGLIKYNTVSNELTALVVFSLTILTLSSRSFTAVWLNAGLSNTSSISDIKTLLRMSCFSRSVCRLQKLTLIFQPINDKVVDIQQRNIHSLWFINREGNILLTLFVKFDIIPTICLPDPCACKIPLWKSSFPYNPRPIAAQQNSVVVISVHFWHDWDFDLRDFRSQHLVNRYKSRPTSAKISIAAGIDARIPRLWNIGGKIL